MSYLVFEISLKSIRDKFEVVHPEFFSTKLEALKHIKKSVQFDDRISALDSWMKKYMSEYQPSSCIRSVIFGDSQYEIHRVRTVDPMLEQESKFPHMIVKYNECMVERIWGFNSSKELYLNFKSFTTRWDLKFGSQGKCTKCSTMWIHLIDPEDELINYVAYVKI